MYILYIFMYNIASNNVISIECNTAESYSKKSIKPNNANISTRKKVNFRCNRKKQEGKKDQIVTAIVVIFTARRVSKYGVTSGPYFSAFGLNRERYFVSLRIQS